MERKYKMLLELAIGDAYGSCFEGGVELEFRQAHNDLTYNTSHEMPSLVPKGHYTDDTQMTLAIAEAVLDDGPWDKESLADRFVKCFQRDQRRGYTTAFLIFLMNSENGKDLLLKIDGKSTKSGSAMRASPVGLYPELQDVIDISIRQADVTHKSAWGRGAAVAAAMMVHYFVYNLGPKDQLSGWLRDEYFGDELFGKDSWSPIKGDVSVQGKDCVEAAARAIMAKESLGGILQECIIYGGDTDTVATIALAAASWSKEIEQELPEALVSGLENKKYGKDYLIKLDSQLKEKFGL